MHLQPIFKDFEFYTISKDGHSISEDIFNRGVCLPSDTKNTDESWLENISIKEAMKKLTDREKLILNLRFFNGRTQMEVAEEIGISQAQVSRLEKTALKHMRKHV